MDRLYLASLYKLTFPIQNRPGELSKAKVQFLSTLCGFRQQHIPTQAEKSSAGANLQRRFAHIVLKDNEGVQKFFHHF